MSDSNKLTLCPVKGSLHFSSFSFWEGKGLQLYSHSTAVFNCTIPPAKTEVPPVNWSIKTTKVLLDFCRIRKQLLAESAVS